MQGGLLVTLKRVGISMSEHWDPVQQIEADSYINNRTGKSSEKKRQSLEWRYERSVGLTAFTLTQGASQVKLMS